MEIKNAENVNIQDILELYIQAKNALQEQGVDQWQDGYPNRETLIRDMEAGISRVCIDGHQLLATAAAYVGHEPTYDLIYDGAWLTESKSYGIIHRIAVSPKAKGRGIAAAVFAFTEELSKNAHVTSLRCDTHCDNLAMQSSLTKFGFKLCGTILLEDGGKRLAYEKII